MKNKSKEENLKEKILAKIKSGQVKMKPRSYFVAKIVGLVTIIIIAFGGAIFLGSLLFFLIHRGGLLFLPAFGPAGLLTFIGAFPWLIALLAVIFAIMVEVFIAKFSFSYHRPLFYSALLVAVVLLLGSYAIFRANLHENIRDIAEKSKLPIVRDVYNWHGRGMHHGEVYVGRVLESNDFGLSIITQDGFRLEVVVTEDTHFPFGHNIKINEEIIVMGEEKNDKIYAQGIRKINGDGVFVPERHFHMRHQF